MISYSCKKKYHNHRHAGVSGHRIDETYVSSGATRTTIACSRLQKLIVMCKDRDGMTDAKNARWQRLYANVLFSRRLKYSESLAQATMTTIMYAVYMPTLLDSALR